MTRPRAPRWRKALNRHAAVLGPLYFQAPKPVLAAVLVEVLAGGRAPDPQAKAVREKITLTWAELHRRGVVPAGPPKEET